MEAFQAVLALAVALGLYFFPAIVAWNRGHLNTLAIFVLNLFLGWIIIGWIVALIWACTNNIAPRSGPTKLSRATGGFL